MTIEKKSSNNELKDIKPIKKISPFVSDPFNTRGGKGGKGNVFSSGNSVGKGKKINIAKFKGGSGGDR